jgi:Ni/Co efflux regulator RcnB
MAAFLVAGAIAAGFTPMVASAQDMMMDRGPRPRPEAPMAPGGPGNPGGPAGRVERGEGRPIFHDRESFPENRPEYRPTHPEAPRPPQVPPAPDRGPGGGFWGNHDGRPPAPNPGGPHPYPDRPDPNRGDWHGDPGWRGPGPAGQWRDPRWRDEERRREERDRWQRSYGDWRDHGYQNYGFAERRAWADQWNSGWRRDRRYDWMGWRSLNRGVYRLPRYYAPEGIYGYQRFSSGVIMEPMFFGQSYWLSDPYAYRLPPAYGPYRWVRYYNDAVLVDLRSGLVVDIVYDIFW